MVVKTTASSPHIGKILEGTLLATCIIIFEIRTVRRRKRLKNFFMIQSQESHHEYFTENRL